MIAHYAASDRLRRLRISRRCYSLLHGARIDPSNLQTFYRTYRLPADPFFPLFFTIKRSYLADRERVRDARRRYILDAMRSLPGPVLANIKYLGYLERHYNAAGRSPVWQDRLFPATKRQADAYTRLDAAAWLALLRRHLALLERRYPALTAVVTDRVHAGFVLGLSLGIPPTHPRRTDVARRYRALSLLHHPDRGGDPAGFIEAKRARDVLWGKD
jgi:hypothetical protein